ncbi:hypothetical protein CRM22_003002 [Opisthorchis felineus]|uniref:HECT-type E3 ubiquitin transferase n=1 Tax=Opisthorchis felineus TaxID=147828 RepID=A0A4S2M3B5_OPIFE|nr:hypothetical protein CRM22_003002 [Opisthorchis felineus]
MSSATTRVKRLITRYFNQLLRGCQNSRCQNPNCASSSQFRHSRLTPNQAAILAIQLTTNQAELCYPDEAATDTGSENMPLNTEDREVIEQPIDATESRQVTAPDHATSSASNLSPSGALNAAVDASSLSNVIEDEESSRTSFMTPGEVTRLLMFLFDAADNEDVAQPRSSDNQTALTDAEENQSSHYSSLFSPNYGCGAFLDAPASGANTTARPSSSSLTPFLSSANPSSDALKSFLNNTNPSSNLASLVSSLNTIQERESRTHGLTLGELKETLDIGKEQGDWSHLISLLSAVFSSYEALSSSFLAEPQRVADDSDLLAHRTNAKKPREDTGTEDVIPMDVSVSIGEIMSKMDQHALGKPTADDSCESSMDRQDTKTSLLEDLPIAGDVDPESTTPVPPVSIPDVRLAWSLISSIPEQQNVVDVLLRAVRRLVVGSLYQLLVSQAPDGLGDVDPPPLVRNTQQRLLNLFCILYECPFATDPLHFDHLLLNINRAVTWLPISLQARLCHIWADTVRLPLANCTTPPAPEQTNLWSLQSILQQNITLRCLTTSHGVPNEDKQLCEAALVLRIVYYASLLAGRIDKKELLEREAVENRDFELLMRAHRSHEPRVGRSRNGTIEDPLAKALSVSPNDCRHPFIPAKDFINETLNEHLKAKRDYVNYRSKDTFGELSFMRLPFLLQTGSKSVLLYYDNRMRMLDEQRGAFLQSLFVDNPELPYLKIHVSRDQIVEGALLADLYSGLRALLDYTGDDVEEAFGCNFVVAYQDPFGNTLYHELKPDGTNVHVTKENRQEFVDLYANFLLNESVKKSFNAFRRGFQLVVDESPLSFLFRPDEIELLVCGSRFYDFKELERVTTYEDYTVDSPVIKNFWGVVHNMTTDQQRQLLQFCTGSDRIPVGGMAKMKFTIARQGADTDRLPTAHTCFNILLLPDYPSREELERMLLLAITHCKGFGVS